MNITDAKKMGIKIPKDIVLTKEEWKDLYVTLADFKSRVMSRRKDTPEPPEPRYDEVYHEGVKWLDLLE